MLSIAISGTAGCKRPPEYYPPDLPVSRVEEGTRWRACAWDPKARDRLAECAFVSVPADYGRPDGERMRLLVKRRRAREAPSAQIWLVHGGPGASAAAGMKELSFGITELRPDIEFYAVDHRGTGGSAKLACPEQEVAGSPGGVLIEDSEWPNCVAAIRAAGGERLARVSTTNAARDLARLVAKYRAPDVPVFVYGGSYGAYMVRRYLQLAPDQPDGVILEGLPGADNPMTGYDRRMEEAGLRLLAACDAAAECARHFDRPVRTATLDMLGMLDRGHCGFLNLDAATARRLLAAMTFYADTRILVPPLVHRLRRCSVADMWFVARLFLNFAAVTKSGAYSPVLHYHVALSEMYAPGEPTRALEAQFRRAVLSTGMELSYSRLYPRWPRYPRDRFVGREPDFAGPMLLLQGGLDTPAPLAEARAVGRFFERPRQHFVLFPMGAHGVTGQTPTRDGRDCARDIYLGFVDRRERPPNTSCVGRILPLDWRSVPENTRKLAGTVDLWGD